MLDGLTRPFKELPPKHLYDARGAELFDRICELPEYYPTRTERAILRRDADAIVRRTGMAELVELGSGTASKTRVLLDAMERAGTLWRYVPFDVAEQTVRDCAAALAEEYPALASTASSATSSAICAEIPPPEPRPAARRRVPGRHDRQLPAGRPPALPARARADCCRAGDYLLLGTDLVKDVDVLEAAYDDAAGVTAEFNRNVLHVLNRELDADFPTELFEHVAFFDPEHEWIEMRLRARRACRVRIGALDLEVEFARGEELRTEISAKFTRARAEGRLRGLRARAGGVVHGRDGSVRAVACSSSVTSSSSSATRTKPHFSSTRIEPALCGATSACSGRSVTALIEHLAPAPASRCPRPQNSRPIQ